MSICSTGCGEVANLRLDWHSIQAEGEYQDERWGGIIEELDRLLNKLDKALDAFAPPLSPDDSIFDSFIAFR